ARPLPVGDDDVPLDGSAAADPVAAGPEERDTATVPAGQQPGLVRADVIAGDNVSGRPVLVSDLHAIGPVAGNDVPLQFVRDAIGVRPDPITRGPPQDADSVVVA